MFTSMTPAERVTKAIIMLQKKRPFFAYILMHFEAEQSESIPTFAVNKYGHLYFNAEFVEKQTNDQLQYILCHEALHIAKGDFFRVGARNPMIWNIASDCAINHMCNQEGMTPPSDGIIPDGKGVVEIAGKKYKIDGLAAEEIYDILIEDIPQITVHVNSKNGEEGESNTPGHGGFDVHLEGDKDDKGESTGEGGGGSGESIESSAAAAAAANKWKKVTVEAATVARQKGNLPGFAEELIEGLLNPKIDWRTRLKSLVTDEIPMDYTNRRPGRSFYGTGAWCPQVLRENINLFISIDCSGSTSGDRERFVSECVGIMGAHAQIKARLICWDTDVSEANDIEVTSNTPDKIAKLNLRDISGGTEFSAYADYIERKGYTSRMHIVLTDGYIEEKPRVPAGKCVFVLCGGATDSIVKNYGEVLYIKDEN